MAYPNGTPRPDYDRLEVAHDLLGTAMASLSEAMGSADEWNQRSDFAHDEGLSHAESVEEARQDALSRITQAVVKITEAGQDAPPFVPGGVAA